MRQAHRYAWRRTDERRQIRAEAGKKALPLRFLALLLLNVVLVVLAVVFAVKLHHVTNLLITQSAAEVWKGQSEENFVQVSAFQPVGKELTESQIETFHHTLE